MLQVQLLESSTLQFGLVLGNRLGIFHHLHDELVGDLDGVRSNRTTLGDVVVHSSSLSPALGNREELCDLVDELVAPLLLSLSSGRHTSTAVLGLGCILVEVVGGNEDEQSIDRSSISTLDLRQTGHHSGSEARLLPGGRDCLVLVLRHLLQLSLLEEPRGQGADHMLLLDLGVLRELLARVLDELLGRGVEARLVAHGCVPLLALLVVEEGDGARVKRHLRAGGCGRQSEPAEVLAHKQGGVLVVGVSRDVVVVVVASLVLEVDAEELLARRTLRHDGGVDLAEVTRGPHASSLVARGLGETSSTTRVSTNCSVG
ncbi:hypothetical protein M426DRAFT_241752 [Hypoxylon sp. CI-4A]|nr:hypothetical protein M426DRAFT_241752 [Hypoxylon sp. CI-4A]